MSAIWLLDTSIYLNVLDVAGYNQDRKQVLSDFRGRHTVGDSFLLPLATVWESGNHIAQPVPDTRITASRSGLSIATSPAAIAPPRARRARGRDGRPSEQAKP